MVKGVIYFARTASMAAVVWNPEKDCTLAEFNKMGLFATADDGKMAVLRKMGYLEVTAEQIRDRGMEPPEPDTFPSATWQPGKPEGYGPGDGGVAQREEPIFMQQTQKRTLR